MKTWLMRFESLKWAGAISLFVVCQSYLVLVFSIIGIVIASEMAKNAVIDREVKWQQFVRKA